MNGDEDARLAEHRPPRAGRSLVADGPGEPVVGAVAQVEEAVLGGRPALPREHLVVVGVGVHSEALEAARLLKVLLVVIPLEGLGRRRAAVLLIDFVVYPTAEKGFCSGMMALTKV